MLYVRCSKSCDFAHLIVYLQSHNKSLQSHNKEIMKAERILYCIFGVFLFAACSGGEDYEQQLEWFEEMNSTDVPLCVDSVQPLVRHYDHWWHSRNHRMRAYYMLGCAYRDQGEAPAAIHYYHIATEKADTIHADSATYATLFRIYGQMAMIYEQQNMPEEEIETLDKLSKYASLAHDTLTSIMGEERKVVVYSQMDDTANVLRLTESVSQQYLKLGFAQKAARTFPTAIYVCLINKDYARARQYMDFFEKESGLFDEAGNIESGREQYYYSKGLYFMSQGEIDSAEICYRKLIPCGYLYEAYKGLLSVYESRNINDSIAKYIELTEQALEQWMANQQGTAIIQSSAMYRYERNRNAAIVNARKAEQTGYLSLFILLSAIILYGYARKRLQEKETKIKQMYKEYTSAINEHEQLKKEFQTLKHNYDCSNASADTTKLLEKKQERIEYLEGQIKTYRSNLRRLSYAKREKLLRENEIVVYFIGKTTITPKWSAPKEEKWRCLTNTYAQYMPLVSSRMGNSKLSRQERFTCILTHLEFASSDIAVLLETSASRISNAKNDACAKLFGKGHGKQLRKWLISIECENDVKFSINT